MSDSWKGGGCSMCFQAFVNIQPRPISGISASSDEPCQPGGTQAYHLFCAWATNQHLDSASQAIGAFRHLKQGQKVGRSGSMVYRAGAMGTQETRRGSSADSTPSQALYSLLSGAKLGGRVLQASYTRETTDNNASHNFCQHLDYGTTRNGWGICICACREDQI